jgi:hypothetical protein
VEICARVYRPRRPKETLLYRLLSQHIEESGNGSGVVAAGNGVEGAKTRESLGRPGGLETRGVAGR